MNTAINGLEPKQINKNYSFLKGRLGEAITEQLFTQLGYKVFRYGIENTVPGIAHLIHEQRGAVIESIRSQPDFVVQSTSGKWLFLEVKYRAELKLNVKTLSKYDHHEVQFVVINPGFIGSISKKEVLDRAEEGVNTITAIDHLSEHAVFGFNDSEKLIISQFEIYTQAFFNGLPSFSELCDQANEYL